MEKTPILPSPTDLPVDGETVTDLSIMAEDTPQLAKWRAKRLAEAVLEGLIEDHGEGTEITQINIFSAGLVIAAHDPEGEIIAPTAAIDPDLSPGVDEESGFYDPGEHLRTISMEQGFALSRDMRDESASPMAFSDMQTALSRTLLRPEGAHLSNLTISMVVHLEEEKFDRNAARVPATTPTFDVPQ